MKKERQTFRETDKAVYFWGGPLSQWKRCLFTDNEKNYTSAEQYMMRAKALLFKDTRIADLILSTNDPKEVKALGREISGFSEDLWNQHKLNIVIQGNILKFSQDETLKKTLLDTGDKLLVEGSPYDVVWGVGLEWSDPAIEDEKNWRGQNLLGVALMEVRRQLKP